MTEQTENCTNCIHCHRVTDPNMIGLDTFQCRAVPPAPLLVPNPQGLAMGAFYPPVSKDTPKCGKYTPKLMGIVRE